MPKKNDDNRIINLLETIKEKTDRKDVPLDDELLSNIKFSVSTRSAVIDNVIAGGRKQPCTLIPFGRQVEISGKPHSGKTTLCAQTAAEVQSRGGLVVVIDSEDRIDSDYWTKLGVNMSAIHHLYDRTLEDVFNAQYKFLKAYEETESDVPILMIWDSLGGTHLKDIVGPEVDPDDLKKNPMAVASRLMGKPAKVVGTGLELINPLIARNNVCYMYTNHMYMIMNSQFPAFETYGGMKAKYLATLRLRVNRLENIEEKDSSGATQIVGTRVTVEALKNSMSPYLLTKTAAIVGATGFNNAYTVYEYAVSTKIIKKEKAWCTWTTPKGEEVKFQGWAGFQDKVVNHPEYTALSELVFAAI